MRSSATFRYLLHSALALLLLLPATWGQAAQFGGHRGGGSIAGRPSAGQRSAPGPRPNQEHLEQWLNRHNNLPLAEQQRALGNEPGFRDLPPQTQQNLRDRLNQLNNMSPELRRRTLERTEIMERLSIDQRQQFRTSVQQLGRLPDDRRRIVARAEHDLREMPLQQRQEVLNSERFRSQFSDQERNTLSGLLAVEPYIPPEHPNGGPGAGR